MGSGHAVRRRSTWAARVIAALLLLISSLYARPAAAYQAGDNESQGGTQSLADCRANRGLAQEFMAFMGHDGQLNLLQYPDNKPVNPYPADDVRYQSLLHEYSFTNPAITCVNEPFGDLYIAWVSTTYDTIYIGKLVFVDNTAHILVKYKLGESTQGDIGLASDNGHNLVLTWIGTDAMHHVNVYDINLQTSAVQKYVTTDYSFNYSGATVAWNGVGYPSKGELFAVAFLDANGGSNGNRPYIFLGRFSPVAPSVHLTSSETSQYSQLVPSLSPSLGLLLPVFNGRGGGRVPQPDGLIEAIWLGFYDPQINVGYWPTAGDMIHARGFASPDDLTNTPGVDGCHTAYADGNTHIIYDNYPYFPCY